MKSSFVNANIIDSTSSRSDSVGAIDSLDPLDATLSQSDSRAAASARRLWAACLVIMGLLLWCFNPNYTWSEARVEPYGSDFVQEWTAADMIWSGQSKQIYRPEQFSSWQHDSARLGFSWRESSFYPAVYPPSYYCCMLPFAGLPYRFAVPVWLALILASYWASASLVQTSSDSRAELTQSLITTSNAWVWLLGIVTPSMFFGCVMGQKGSLWLLILAASWCLFQTRRSFSAGMMLALLTLKPTLCPLVVAGLLVGRQWRAIAGWTIGVVALFALSSCLTSPAIWYDYITSMLSGMAGYQDHGGYRSGWSTTLLSWLRWLHMPRGASLALWGVAALVLCGLIYRLTQRDRSRDAFMLNENHMLLCLLATSILSPHFYFYDLVWLLLPIALIGRTDTRRAAYYLVAIAASTTIGQHWEFGPPFTCLVLLWIFGDTYWRCGHAQPIPSEPRSGGTFFFGRPMRRAPFH